MRIDPAVMPKDSVPRPLTLYGDGFAPGQVVQIGSQAFSLPDTVGPRRAVITVSPVFQPPGDVAVSMQDAPPGTTARLLRILGAPALLSASPAVVAPNALVELTVRDLGRDRDSVTAELLIAGAPSTAAEFLTLGPSDSGDTDADRVVIDLGELPTIVATTSATLRLTGSGGTVDVPLSLAARPTATYEREISFFATAPLEVADRFEEAVALTSGSLTPQGIFQQVDTAAWEDGAWYCPVTIGPPAARVPTPCSHFTNICDELWYWEDTSDASEWWDITRPPGLPAGGPRCPEVPGPNSWAGIQGDAIADTVRTNAAVDLAGITIVGRHDTYVLDNASGGGLTIAPPTSGGPSHVTLDATVTDAVGTVITLDGVEDVTIPMLSIVGTNACTTGLHITGSARVRVQTLVVDGCATGLHIEDSQDVVVDAVVILDANRAVFIDQGKRVSVGGFVGLNPVTGQFAASGTDGIVVVGDSRDVAVTPAVVGALSGDGVRIGSASDVFVSVDALGFAAGPNGQLFGQGGSPVTAGASVGTGVRVRPTAERVTIADTHVFQATDGIVIEGARDVVVRRVLAGGSTSHQAATLPPGLSGTGVRVEGAVRNVDIRDVGFGRAPLGGLVVDAVQSADPMTGEVFARGVRSGAGQAGSQIVASVSGCGVWVDSSSGVWLEDVALHGDTVGLCVESSSQLRLLDLGVQDTEATAVALSGSDVELDEAVLLSSGSDAVSVIDAVGLRARLLLVDGAASVGLNVMGTPASASASISVVESSIKNTGLAGVMSTSALQVYLSASEVCEASTTSVDLASSGGGVLHEVAVGRCSTGTPSSKASVGVDASHAVGPVTIRASVIEGHQDAGVRADDAAATIELRESVIRTNSNHGLSVSGETIMRVVDTAFDGNQGDAIALTGLLGEGRLEVEGGAIGTDSPNASAVRSSGCTADSGVPVRFVGVDNADDVVIDGCAAPLELSDSSFGILSMANLQSGTVKAVSGRALSVVDVADARFLDLVLSQGCTIAGAASVRNRARSPEAGELTLLETANNGLAAPDLYSTRYRSDGSWRLVGGNVADHAVVEVWDISGASPRWVGATHVVGGRFDVVLHGLTTDAVFGVASTLPDGSSSPMGGPQTVSPPTTDTCDELAPASDSGDSLWIDERGLADAGGVLVAGATAADRCGDFAVYAANGGLGLLDIGTGELAPFDGFTGVATEPTFSPDCARVAWVGEVAGQVDLFELFVQAPTPVQITDDAAVESGPAYGANNLFFSASSGGEDAAIYAFDASAPTATPALVVDQLGDDEAPSWSPDGDLLAWQRCADDRCEVSVVGLESGVSTVVTRAEGCDDRRPRWQVGPNGDRSLMVRRSAVGAAASSAVVGVNRFGLTLGRLDAGASPAISPVSGP